jgi:hypothetical protein
MDAGIFIKKINKGQRNFDNVVIDGIVNPDLIDFGPSESISVTRITLTHYDEKRHVQFVAPVFEVQGDCTLYS